jgi:RNA polymerase primary sigma factor
MTVLQPVSRPKVPSATRASKKSPKRTFTRKALEFDFLKYCQLSTESTRGCDRKAAELVRDAAEHIGSEMFAERGSESTILGDQLLLTLVPKAGRSAKLASLPSHLAGLCEHPLLSQENERAMFQRMNYLKFRASRIAGQVDHVSCLNQWDMERIAGLLRAAKWHRDSIVQANLRLVISIVKKFSNQHCSFDDLLSDGIIALMRAVEKFDYERGFRFSTYATQVVRRNCYRMVMERQQERLRVTNSMNEPGMDVADDVHSPTMSEGRWNSLRGHLGLLLDQLDRREKFIIRARFSLGSHRRVQTLQALADALGVSKERIRQLEKRAMDKLKLLADNNPVEVVEADYANN